MAEPFFIHWYAGEVPPLRADAVNVTLVPVQTAPAGLAAIDTLAATPELTIIAIASDVAGDPVTQPALLVIPQVIISLLIKVVEVYVALVAPEILLPFFLHW